jgi:hypothetical protein
MRESSLISSGVADAGATYDGDGSFEKTREVQRMTAPESAGYPQEKLIKIDHVAP